MKLREVNKLTIVEWFYSYLCIYFFGIVLYFYVYFICVFISISVAVWPYLLIWKEMKWTFNRAHRLTFFPAFHADLCPVTKKCDFIVPVTKPCTFFRRHFALLWRRAPKFQKLGIWVRPTCVCTILSGSVKVCRSYSQNADFEQTHRPIYMTAYNK